MFTQKLYPLTYNLGSLHLLASGHQSPLNASALLNTIVWLSWAFSQTSEPIELIQGEIIQMAAKGTAYEVCLTRLLRELPKCLGDAVTLRCQSPVSLPPNSEP